MDEPIRVLRVIARLNVGGPALHVSYLTRELDRHGYETTLAAGSVGSGEGSMEYVAEGLGLRPLFIPELQREITLLADVSTVRRLVEVIRDVRPHVLHTHTAKAGAVGRTAALLAGRDRPKVVVHTFHGHVLRGYFSPYRTELFRRLEQGLARASDALVAVSPEVRDDLVRLGVAPASKIAVIRLGLDLDGRVAARPGAREELRRSFGVPPSRFLIGWLGRMTEIKRVDLLLDSFALIRAAGVDAELLLAGDGPLRAGLERQAAALGISGRCHFAGFRTDVGEILAAADAVALTSANEGTPVSVIEALAAGRPVVSTDVGGVGDVVVDGETGFLVEPGDTAAFADRLARLADGPGLRERAAASALAVRARYAIPRLVSDLDLLYRELLQQADPRERRVVGPLDRPLTPALPRRPRVPRAERRLRVLLLSQYFPPEVGATQSRMQAFAEYLASRGHRVTVVCEFPNHPHGVIPDRYRGRIVEDDRSNPYRVLRVWVMATEQKTQLTRMEFYLSYMGLAAAVAPAAGRPDVVFATSPPLFTGAAGLAAARLLGAPLVLDVRDLWPAAALSLNQLSNRAAAWASELLERHLYRAAAAVTAVTGPFCEHIDRIRVRPPQTVLLPNGTLELFFEQPVPHPAANGRFRLTFAGTLGIAQSLRTIVDSAEQAPDLDFAVVGDGPMRTRTVADVGKRGLENVRFHPQVPLEEMPPVLAESDALLVTLSAHPTFRDFVPSKLVDFMATGRPILLSAAGESARILERAGAGVVVPPEEPAALIEAARWLSAHPREAAAMGLRGREFARRRLRSVQAQRLEQVLLDVARV